MVLAFRSRRLSRKSRRLRRGRPSFLDVVARFPTDLPHGNKVTQPWKSVLDSVEIDSWVKMLGFSGFWSFFFFYYLLRVDPRVDLSLDCEELIDQFDI